MDAVCSFIDNNSLQNGSLVYYAVDEAVSDIKAPDYPSDLSDAVLVTFTDGLDQGSLMKKSYSTNDQYLSAVKQKIDGARVEYNPLTAYSIGIRGSDVSDISGYKANLEKLASSSSNAYEITDISSLQNQLNQIANVISVEQTYTYTYTCNLTVTIPGVGNGTRVRFTFDNVSDASQSKLYIEGVFNLSTRSFTNVVYYGFSSGAGSTVSGTVNGIFVTYTFNGLQKSDGTQLSTSYMKEWTSDSSQSSWQRNSEFNNSNDVSTEVSTSTSISRKSAVIYLVLDYSTSIGSKSSSMKSAAKNFVWKLQQKSNDPYAVAAVSLDMTEIEVFEGKSRILKATVSPKTAEDKSIIWSSSDPSIVAVDREGRITGLTAGTAIITVTTVDGGYSATCSVTVIGIDMKGRDYVDLGLPSDLLWATMNVGATKPEEYGDYFAWGETEPKENYSWSTYKWCQGSEKTLTKYNTDDSYGTVDKKTVLDLKDDAAHVNWGGSWRMPTYDEWTELRTNCTWTWTDNYNGIGVKGMIVTSKKSGYTDKSIFLPAADKHYGTAFYDAGKYGHYWSSSLIYYYPSSAGPFSFDSSKFYKNFTDRSVGQSVRPVTDFNRQ